MKRFLLIALFLSILAGIPTRSFAADYYICSGDIANASDWWDTSDCSSGTSGQIPTSADTGYIVGTVDSDTNVTIDYQMIIDGNTLQINEDAFLEGGSITVQSGSLMINTGTFTQMGSITIDGGSTLGLTSRFDISAGDLTLQGNLQINSGGEFHASYDHVYINGGTFDVNAGGTLVVDGGTVVTNSVGTLNVNTSGTLNTTSGTTTNNGTFTSRGTIALSGTAVMENYNAGYFALSGSMGVAVDFDPFINAHVNNYNTLFAHTGTLYAASGLPSGLTVNSSTGRVTGTPVATSSGNFTITSTGSLARQRFSYSIGAGDVTPPTITNVNTTVASSSATITWDTGEAASSYIRFGLTSSYSATTTEFNTTPRVISHSVMLTSLISCTTYHYKVLSRDAAGNTASSSNATFTTLGCVGGDAAEVSTTTLSITSESGGTVSFDASSGRVLGIVVPALFTSATSTRFVISELETDAVFEEVGQPSAVVVVGKGFDLKALESATSTISVFDQPLSISLSYTHAEIVGILEGSLRIYSYDGTRWSVLENCTVDSVDDVVTCETSHFSIFALFGTAEEETRRRSSSRNAPSPQVKAEGVSNVAPAPNSFNSDLWIGMTSADVKRLQIYLNEQGFAVATIGYGSAGNETEYFGARTQQALKRFQAAHGIPATGYFGPITRAFVNK
jgi:hypothetical protein